MNRQLLFLLLSLFASPVAFADCASSGVYVYPKSGEIHQNSLIMIEGYATSKEMVNDFGEKHKVKLVSDNHQVELVRVKQFTGMMHLIKIVFKPAELLKLNTTYELVVEDLEKEHHDYPKYWNNKKRAHEFYSYEVTKAADYIKPKWEEQPKHKENSKAFFGCGPAIYAIFGMSANEIAPIYVKTECYNLTTEKSTIYMLPLEESHLNVGHGMCSGAFTYKQGDDYKIRFRLYDSCGNENESWSEWINFKNPALAIGQ